MLRIFWLSASVVSPNPHLQPPPRWSLHSPLSWRQGARLIPLLFFVPKIWRSATLAAKIRSTLWKDAAQADKCLAARFDATTTKKRHTLVPDACQWLRFHHPLDCTKLKCDNKNWWWKQLILKKKKSFNEVVYQRCHWPVKVVRWLDGGGHGRFSAGNKRRKYNNSSGQQKS